MVAETWDRSVSRFCSTILHSSASSDITNFFRVSRWKSLATCLPLRQAIPVRRIASEEPNFHDASSRVRSSRNLRIMVDPFQRKVRKPDDDIAMSLFHLIIRSGTQKPLRKTVVAGREGNSYYSELETNRNPNLRRMMNRPSPLRNLPSLICGLSLIFSGSLRAEKETRLIDRKLLFQGFIPGRRSGRV